MFTTVYEYIGNRQGMQDKKERPLDGVRSWLKDTLLSLWLLSVQELIKFRDKLHFILTEVSVNTLVIKCLRLTWATVESK